jgi:sensor domain CHASE-containing protein
MSAGIFAIIMLGLWLLLRLRRADQEEQVQERSTLDVLKSIESKLDQIVLAQNVKISSEEESNRK